MRTLTTRFRHMTAFATVPILLALLLGPAAVSRAAPAGRLPNVVLCMADDQGYGDVGYYGHPVLKTPTLDEMAAAGLRLDRFYAAAPVCSPTRGSVLTGRHPNRYGCFSWGRTIRPQEVTVAEALKKAGYVTGHFGKWHVGPVTATSPVSPGNSGFDRWLSSPNFFDNDPWMSREGKAVKTEGESSHVTAEAAIEFIREVVPTKKPFLAVVWFGSPHGPHIAAEEYRRMYADQPKAQANFYGELTGMDHAIGLLRQELRDLGITDNTLFWYTSDNGALSVGSTRGLRGHKGNLYEGGVRVPAIIEWPDRIPKPRTSDVIGSTVDIYPTLLDIAGVKIDEQPPLDGVSLLPLFEGKMDRREKPLGFWVYPVGGIGTRSSAILEAMSRAAEGGPALPQQPPFAYPDVAETTRQYPEDQLPGPAAWVDGHWKLHRLADKKADKVSYALYDLAADPEETTDVAADHPEQVQQMKAALDAWQKSVVRSLNGEDY